MDVLERWAGRIGTGVDVVLGVVMAVVLAVNARQVALAGGRWPFALGVGLVICATALLRGRNRARAAALGLAIFALAALAAALRDLPAESLTGGALIGLLVLGGAAARTLPLRPAVVIAAAGAVIVAASQVGRAAATLDARALFALTGALAWAAAIGAGLWLRYLDRQRRAALDAVRRDERLGLARELHDVVAHHVTGIVVQSQAAGFAGAGQPETLAAALASIESAGTDALFAMRRLVGLLRDPGDAGQGATAPESLSGLVERFARRGPPVDLRVPADLPGSRWPPEVTSTVYRIVQEALTNIARHAPAARSATVTITDDLRRITVEITDDGPAVPPPHARPASGYGLVGMRERVEALGGKVLAGPLPQAGWAVRASLPVPVRGHP